MSRTVELDLGALVACDIEHAGSELSTMLEYSRRVRGWLDRFDAEAAARLQELYQQGMGMPAADELSRNQGCSAAEGRKRERRSKTLGKTSRFGDALADGAVTAEHVDALANVTARLDQSLAEQFFGHERDLLAKATTSTPEQFSRHCRNLVTTLERDEGLARNERQRRETCLTRKIDRDGMYTIHGRFHPELGERIWKAIDHEVAATVAQSGDREADRHQLAAEGLGNLVTGGHQAVRAIEADVVLVADLATMLHGQHDHTLCETESGVPLPPESVRRLICNGTVHPVIVGVDGVPLNVGRGQRLATRAQRRALRAMYRSCAIDHCDVPFGRCEIHHILPFELGGRTDLHNLLPLCSRHHHLVHELGWRLDLSRDRTLTIRRPDGTVDSVSEIQIRPTTRIWNETVDNCQRVRQRLRALQRTG
jgi:hypothetical protein